MIIWHLLVLHVCIQSSGPPMGKTVILNVDEETELERSANLLRVIELLQDEGCVWSQPAWLHPSHHDRITLEASSAWGSDIYWTSMGKSSLRCIVKDVHYMRLKYLFLFSLHFNYPFFFLSLSLYVSAYPFSWGLGPALHPLSFVSSTFWTPPNMFLLPFLFVFPQRFPLPFCLPKSLLLALCSMPVFFFFFFLLSFPHLCLISVVFSCLDICQTKSWNSSRVWSQPPDAQHDMSPRICGASHGMMDRSRGWSMAAWASSGFTLYLLPLEEMDHMLTAVTAAWLWLRISSPQVRKVPEWIFAFLIT